jgi:hypothetical protein
MSGISHIPQLPTPPTYDPLGRTLTEEQRVRLREQPAPPVEETLARERLRERRREDPKDREERRRRDDDGEGPGRIVDSYA